MQSLRLFRRNDLKLKNLLFFRLHRRRLFASECSRFAENQDSDGDNSSDESGNLPANDSTKVTVIGAAGRVGRTLSLLLKTSPLVDQLCLFDIHKSVRGVSVDISHIDTKCRVCYVCGMESIQDALDNPDVVLIAAGSPTTHLRGKKLFRKNAPIVAGLSEACARYCPEACIVLLTNPINSLLPVAGEVYKLVTGKQRSEKLFGLTTLDVVRANTFTAEAIRHDPNKVIVPVIGGTSEDTIVPVISQMKPCCKIKHEEIVALTECVKQAEASLKDCQNCGTRGSSSLSTAYAAFRFSSALISALRGEKNVVECAYVQSDIIPELEYLASPLKLGRCGVEYNYGYPDLSDYEVSLMERAAPALQRAIEAGLAYVMEQCRKHEKKRCGLAEIVSAAYESVEGKSPFETVKSEAFAIGGKEDGVSEYEVKLMENGAIALRSDITLGKTYVVENKSKISKSLANGSDSSETGSGKGSKAKSCGVYEVTELIEQQESVVLDKSEESSEAGPNGTVKAEAADFQTGYSAVFPLGGKPKAGIRDGEEEKEVELLNQLRQLDGRSNLIGSGFNITGYPTIMCLICCIIMFAFLSFRM